MKEHLRCEGLYDGETDGVMGHEVIDAMQRFHRRHMIISWQLDAEQSNFWGIKKPSPFCSIPSPLASRIGLEDILES